VLFLLHVVGVEGLHGVGFELVVAVEGGVEAEELLGVQLNNRVNQFFGDALFEAEQECAVGNGEEFFAADGFRFNPLRQGESCLEEDFIEQLFRRCARLNVRNVLEELVKNAFWWS